MQLSLREKQSFYEHLAQLLRAGVAFPGAVEKLAQTSRGGERRMLYRLRDFLKAGKTVGEAFGALRPAVSEMECTALNALERSGRMDKGLQQLADYFGALQNARKEVIQRSAYPIFVLHFGVLVTNLPTLVVGAGLGAYLRQTLFALFIVYGALAILFLLVPLLNDLGTKSPAWDWFFHRIPFAGKIRRSFALARFCATYDMQLEAGVNVIDSLVAAGRASCSGLISAAVAAAVPEIRKGSQVGVQLAQSRAFPESFTRTVLVAEESGELDRALARLTLSYHGEALQALASFAEWIPRLVYVGVCCYLACSVISGYKGYFDNLSQIDSM